MKVKLRDLTLEQYEKWKEENCPAYGCKNKLSCHKCVFCGVDCSHKLTSCWIYRKDMFSDKFLNQEIEIDCETILTEEEHEYLSNVIKPFRDRIEYIEKYESTIGYHYLSAFNDSYKLFICKFCLFSKEEYKGLELYKRYTLEELGL